MSINRVATIFHLALLVIQVLLCGNISYAMSGQSSQLNRCTISSLPHFDNDCQWSINNCLSCIIVNQGIAWIFEIITEPLTVLVVQNTKHTRKYIDYNIINIATCKVFKKALLDVEHPNWSNTIIKQQKQEHYINLQMVPLDNPLTTRSIQMDWDISIQLYLKSQLGCIDNLDCQFGDSVNPNWTRIQSDNPEPFLTQASWPCGCWLSKISQSPWCNHNEVVPYLEEWCLVTPSDCLEHEAGFSNHQFLLAVHSQIINSDITHIRPAGASRNFQYI